MDYYRYLDMIWKLSNWYFSKDALPYWCIFVLDCLIVLGADVLVYALNNGTLSLLQNFVQLTFLPRPSIFPMSGSALRPHKSA